MVCFGNHFTPWKKNPKCIIILSIKIKVTKPKPLMINNGWFTSFEKRNGKTVIILIDLQLSQVTRNNSDSVFFKGGEISEEPKKENTNTTKIHNTTREIEDKKIPDYHNTISVLIQLHLSLTGDKPNHKLTNDLFTVTICTVFFFHN